MSRSRKSRWIALAVVLIVPLLAWAAVFIFNGIEEARWHRFAETLHNEPLTLREIEARRPPQAEDPTLASVMLGDASVPEEVIQLKGDFFKGMDTTSVDDARACRDAHIAVVQLLRTTRPAGRFKVDVPAFLEWECPYLGRVRAAGKLVWLDTYLQFIAGSTAGLPGHVDTLLALGDTLATEPSLIGTLIRDGLTSMAVGVAESALRVGLVSEEDLRLAAARFTATERTLTVKWGLLGERAVLFEILQRIKEGDDLDPESVYLPAQSLQMLNWLPDGIVRANQRKSCELLTRLVRVADDPRALRQAAAELDRQRANLPRTQLLSAMLIPSLDRAMDAHLRTIARVGAARAGLAAERFRLKYGTLPEALDELRPEFLAVLPADPFDSLPLKLVQTHAGIVIYSIGDDLVDDGGILVSGKGNRKTGPDHGFRVVLPEHRGVEWHTAPDQQ